MSRSFESGKTLRYGAALLLALGAHSLCASVPRSAKAPHVVTQRAPGYLGIEFHDLTDDQIATLHLKSGRGVEIVMVDHDGPAGKAGLRPHDFVINLNGQPIASADGLRRMIHDAGPGFRASLGVMRGGQQITIATQLADRNDVEREALKKMIDPGPPPAVSEDAPASGLADHYETAPDPPSPAPHSPGFLSSMLHMTPFTGLAMETMEPQLAAFFGAPAGMGLLVQTVMPGSPAAAAGLHAGDIVLRADSVTLRSTSEWTKHLHLSRGQTMTLVVLRDKHELTLTLTPELKKRSSMEWPSCCCATIFLA